MLPYLATALFASSVFYGLICTRVLHDEELADLDERLDRLIAQRERLEALMAQRREGTPCGA